MFSGSTVKRDLAVCVCAPLIPLAVLECACVQCIHSICLHAYGRWACEAISAHCLLRNCTQKACSVNSFCQVSVDQASIVGWPSGSICEQQKAQTLQFALAVVNKKLLECQPRGGLSLSLFLFLSRPIAIWSSSARLDQRVSCSVWHAFLWWLFQWFRSQHLAAPSSSYALIFIKPKSNKRAMSMSQLGTQMLISSDSLGDKQERIA